MARFTKLPVTIEAVQFTPICVGMAPGPAWLDEAEAKMKGQPGAIWSEGDNLYIGTLEGALTVSPGDWIIRGTKGELYPCKPDIFEATYMPEDMAPKPAATLADDLAATINRWSCEGWAGDTPDFILAEFLIGVMRQLGATVGAREKWFGRDRVAVTVPDIPFNPRATQRILYPAEPQPVPYERPAQPETGGEQIIAGLEDAVVYARGDTSKGRATTVHVESEPETVADGFTIKPGQVPGQVVVTHENARDCMIGSADQSHADLIAQAKEKLTFEPPAETVEDLLYDVAELLRGYEAHHRKRADNNDQPHEKQESRAKAERNARMAERVEAMLRRLDQDPKPFRASQPDEHYTVVGGALYKGAPLRVLAEAVKGAVLIEEGACWIKAHFGTIGGQARLYSLLEAAKIAGERA